jgi:hypothetical protein
MPSFSASFFNCVGVLDVLMSRMMLMPDEELMTRTKSDAFASKASVIFVSFWE